ncbi:MAG: ABC transporter transmembrane domain-containing protein [Stappiaceae bacterium]
MIKRAISGRFLPKFQIERSDRASLIKSPGLSRPVVIASILANILGLAMPLTVLQIYDRILPNQSTHTLLLLILGLSAILVFDGAIKITRSLVIGWSAASFGYQAQVEAFQRLVKSPPYLIDHEPVSVQMNRLNSLQSISDFFGGPSRVLAIDLPATMIFFAVMYLIGGPIALVPLVLLVIFAAVTLRRNRELQQTVEVRSDHDNRKYDFVIEVLSGIHTVKSMAMEPLILRRFERLQRQVGEHSYRSIELSNDSQSAAGMYSTFSTVCVVIAGSLMAINGNLSVGAVAACTLLSGQIIQPMLRGISTWTELQRIRHDSSEAEKLFELPLANLSPITVSPISGTMVASGLSHRYEREENDTLKGVAFEFKAGEMIGLRGADGSGRSTLMRIVSGDQKPQAGSIYLDGIDLYGPTHEALRDQISYVGATAPLFRGTILDNLTMFGCSSDAQHGRRAAALIGLEKDIHLLPQGYDTLLGAGIIENLPASTTQRIAIARAIASGPRILILDEANSVLDQFGESALIKALHKLRGQLTILIVSHRPSMLAIADRRYEIAHGILQPVVESERQTAGAKATIR